MVSCPHLGCITNCVYIKRNSKFQIATKWRISRKDRWYRKLIITNEINPSHKLIKDGRNGVTQTECVHRKQNLVLWYQTDRTAPAMGPALGKFHQNFCRNFGRTSPRNWTTPKPTCITKPIYKDPVTTQGPLELPQQSRIEYSQNYNY